MLATRTATHFAQRMYHATQYGLYPPLGSQSGGDGVEEFTVYNPADGSKLCQVHAAGQSDVDASIQRAQEVFDSGAWSKASTFSRAKTLGNLARILEARLPEMTTIECLQTGRTIREMRAQLGRLPEWIDYYAALLRTRQDFVAPTQGKLLNYVQRVPLGVVAQITPFNHPLLIAVKKIAPALAAGNSVIVKPSEWAPITVLEFAKMAQEAGVPEGVLTVLPGFGATTGKSIISNPSIRKVDVTAGTNTGRVMGAIVGSNLAAFTAELGGKAPIVIFDDADLVSAVNGAAFAAFVASGQTCVSGTRLIIQEGIYESFMKLFIEKVGSIRRRMGNPLNPQSTMGTVISPTSLQRIEAMMSRTKGTVIIGGQRMAGLSDLDDTDFSKGAFFPPTVVGDVEITDELWEEEVFGPVVVVKSFKDEVDGIALANACKYGLGAGIWTSDLSRAHRVAAEIEAGLCWVNTHHRNDPTSPWGGMKESGIGRENGIEAFESYSQSKSTIINIAPSDSTRVTDDWFAETGEEKRYG
ncbi:aldehyde dehydrogenase [Cylindrobasidium torrendii FP15055 ss-10]|uniref:Aldehyde dehydrogenase n=1 Tax=Cylindrobasidium torrendii FP15055 ss-10 TaxID=1314674 RepID=A0A0D7BGR4_9AGAR|nr:aldehyde dehydrogenase [Cylindrobasidium torrendii FP15055 ss-10]